MFVYFKKNSNIILYVSPVELGFTSEKLFTPLDDISIFSDEYEVVSLDVDVPYDLQQNKYKLENNEIVYIDSYVKLQDKWNKVRVKRDALLVESDVESGALWIDVWNQKDQETRDAWASYRQALRDIPQGPDPDNVVWPNKPVPVEDTEPENPVAQLP
jgi:hypothetical protein